MERSYPKVLVITHIVIGSSTGGGVTLGNLFRDWPKEKIGFVGTANKQVLPTIYGNYYQLGPLELHRVWPSSWLKKMWNRDGDLVTTPALSQKTKPLVNSGMLSLLRCNMKACFRRIIDILDIRDLFKYYTLSDKFLMWVRNFNPDVIYCVFSDINTARLINQLTKQEAQPLVIHMMDDWPATVHTKGLFSFILRKQMIALLKQLFDTANEVMTISKAMSAEYKRRYRKDFLSFHNPVDLGHEARKSSWQINGVAKIVYAGRMGPSNLGSIGDISEAVGTLNSSGLRVDFEIYTPDYEDFRHSIELKGRKAVRVKPPVDHGKIFEILSAADILLLPLDFDKNSANFAKYSMPTKATEYMISGTPILVYTPPDNAVTLYAKSEGWGYIVACRNQKLLRDSIKALINSEETRAKLGRRAIDVAKRYHDGDKIREDFRMALLGASGSMHHSSNQSCK